MDRNYCVFTRTHRRFVLIIASLLTAYTQSAHIIFDMGGVLFEPDKSAVAKKAGALNLAWYALTHFKNPKVAFFDLLTNIDPYTDSFFPTYDESGAQLPGIFCDWLKGIPSQKILDKIEKTMTRKHLLWPLAQTIFEPHSLALTQRPLEAGKKFVQECIEQGHCCYILSNWDPESFNHLQALYPEFFELFSGIIISGDCGLLKPDPAIYNHLLFAYNIKPADCFFIDNQRENVVAAATIGIAGTTVKTNWHSTQDIQPVRNALHTWLINNTEEKTTHAHT